MKGKLKHILKAIASGFIWGLGQVFNRQYLKAAFFFLFFALLIGIELGSSKLLTGYDPYQEQLPGEDFGENLAKSFYETYIYDKNNKHVAEIPTLEVFYEEHRADGFTNEELIDFTAQDILAGSRTKYYVFSEYIKATNKEIDRDSDLYPEEDGNEIAKLKSFNGYQTTYLNEETGNQYIQKNIGTGTDVIYRYININDENDVLTKEEITGFPILKKENKIYSDKLTATKFYIEVKKNDSIVYYENICNAQDKILVDDFVQANYSSLPKYKGSIWYSPTEKVYVYFNPEISGYNATPFSKYLTKYFTEFYSKAAGRFDQTDYEI